MRNDYTKLLVLLHQKVMFETQISGGRWVNHCGKMVHLPSGVGIGQGCP